MVSRTSHTRLFAHLLRPNRRALAVLAVVLTVASLVPLAGPQLLRAFIDNAVADASLRTLVLIAAGYVGLGLVAQTATIGTTYTATRMAWTATNELREDAAAHALSLDLAFHGTTSPGTLIERIDGDATAITKLFTNVVLKVASGALTVLGAVVLVTLEDWRVGLAFGVFVAGSVAVIARLRSAAVPAVVEERAAFAEVVGLIEEQLDGRDDLRALGAADFALDRHEQASGHHTRSLHRAWGASAWVWTATNGSFVIGSMGMLTGGWLLYRAGTITIGTVFLLFQYVQILRRPMEVIADQLQEVQRAGAGAARIAALLDERAVVRSDGTATLPSGACDVRFDGVGFAYADDGREVLRAIDLSIPAGSVVGLVGATGSGKTTLARLALRLVDATQGAVLLDGVDIRDISAESLRHRIGIVTQDVQLFDASVRDNLTMFSTVEAEDDELTRILDDVGLGAWAAGLPDGLDSVLGPSVGLSAGQAQLVGLARVFLRDPGLIVLDEASSRVDPATAELVEQALDRLLQQRTVIVIAHRLRAVDRADRVVVLDHGRIVEQGTPEMLLADETSRFFHLAALETSGARA